MSRVLVVDDEQHIAEGVRFNLQADGHDVVIADTGEQALDLLLAGHASFDVVVLDVMLPGKDGFAVGVLLARVGGLLRRRAWNERDTPPAADAGAPDRYSFAGRMLDFGAMEIQAQGITHRLTQMECELLRYLVSHPGQVISRKTLLEDVWGLHESTDTRAIDNFVVRLRRYLEDRPGSPQFLLTVRGIGYKFEPGT
jgi:DNA-binding response OmpR family regulator